MDKNNRKSRVHNRKALQAVEAILNKYPNGIEDTAAVSEECRCWLQIKVGNLRQCLTSVYFSKGKPNWWNPIRILRNTKVAHTEEDLSDIEFSKLCNTLFSNINKIKHDLEDNINYYKQPSKLKRKFENITSSIFGSKKERKQLVDAMEDSLQPIEPQQEKIEFPQNTFAQAGESILSTILDDADIQSYVSTHDGVSENIQIDILEWIQKTNKTLQKENPFFDEELFIAQQKKKSVQEIALDISEEKSKIYEQYQKLPSVNDVTRGTINPSKLNFDFYKKAFSKQKEIKNSTDEENKEKTTPIIRWKSKDELKALHRNFINDMETELLKRKTAWEKKQIEAMRTSFLETLFEKIRKFIQLEKLLSPFIGDLGRLWDLSQHPFETSGFEIIESFAELLKNDEFLQELAKLLGKQSREQNLFEKELRDKIVIKTEWHPQPAYRGEINGLCYANDIASTMPNELAMLKNPAVKRLFQLKFAQKQLLAFEYQNSMQHQKETLEQEEVEIAKSKEEPKGPILICVDTSGSMRGAPERIAKTVTFALAKIAMNENRACYLISFSTGIQTLDLSSFKGADALTKLVSFLRMSFNGGTDAAPALHHAVEQLQTNEWNNSDVLMISDFVMGELPKTLTEKIKTEQEKETGFYSLVIGNSGNKNTLKCFDENWNYDPNDRNAQKELVKQLDRLKNRKAKQEKEKSKVAV